MMTRCSWTVLASLLLACSRRGDTPSSHRDGGAQRPPPGAALSAADSEGLYCFQAPGILQVSEDSVGPLHLGMNLQSLRTVCPSARATIDTAKGGTYSSLVFHLRGLTAVAIQWEDSLLPRQPADEWLILGGDGLLYGRLPLTAPLAAFRDALGAGVTGGTASNGKDVTVMFCAHPRVLLDFQRPDSMEDQSRDLSRIPGDARLKQVTLLPRASPSWNC